MRYGFNLNEGLLDPAWEPFLHSGWYVITLISKWQQRFCNINMCLSMVVLSLFVIATILEKDYLDRP